MLGATVLCDNSQGAANRKQMNMHRFSYSYLMYFSRKIKPTQLFADMRKNYKNDRNKGNEDSFL